jgi:hypothetical protein
MKCIWTLVALTTTLALMACGNNTSGGGSDTPNEVAGILLDPNSNPIARKQVILFRQHGAGTLRGYSPVDTAMTEADGSFRLQTQEKGNYALFSHDSVRQIIGTSTQIVLNNDTVQRNISMEYGTRVEGSVLNSTRVQIDTLPIIAIADRDGKFTIPVAPQGFRTLLGTDQQFIPNKIIGSIRSNAGQKVSFNESKVYNGVLLEDFSDYDTRSVVGWALGGGAGGWWYNYGQNAVFNPNDINKSIVDNAGNAYLSIQAQVLSPTNYPQRYAIVGFDIGGGEKFCKGNLSSSCFDLSQIEAIEFEARGSGQIALQIGVKEVLDQGDWGFPQANVPLTSEWKTIRIKPSDLILPAGSASEVQSMDIGTLLKKSYAFTFLMTDSNNSLEIDNFRLVGITLDKMVNP